MIENIPEIILSKEEASVEIRTILQMMQQSGAVDVEPELINDILLKLNSDELSPEEALRKAEGILNSRQDYH